MRNLILAQTDTQAIAYRNQMCLGYNAIRIHSGADCWVYLGKIKVFLVFLACDPIWIASPVLLTFAEKTQGRTLIFSNPSHHEDYMYHLSIIQERKEVFEEAWS